MQVKQTRTIKILSDDSSLPKQEQILYETESDKTKSDKIQEDFHIKKKENRFYLPVLRINDVASWSSKPSEERRHFTDEVATETCLTNCCGVKGLKSACCMLDPDDLEHVLGSVDEEWIKTTVRWFRSRDILMTREDLVIDFDEGRIIGETMFKGHPAFNSPSAYPMLRFQAFGPRFACKFLNPTTGKCTIYPKRPDMCRNYLCRYVKTNFLVHTKEHPNQWLKID